MKTTFFKKKKKIKCCEDYFKQRKWIFVNYETNNKFKNVLLLKFDSFFFKSPAIFL